MKIFSNRFINLLAISISIIIFLIINFILNNLLTTDSNGNFKDEIIEDITDETVEETQEQIAEEEYDWYIEIPSINLKAPIEETTDLSVLNTMVGHFEETTLTSGNVGLAAHNRGYEKNYFENLKDVVEGDTIKYAYNDFSEEYIIDEIVIIENTDWSYLEETKENKITLITCVENEPDYRLCVQGTEKEAES